MSSLFTKETLKQSLMEIRARGWIPNQRPGNDGGVGNTLEDLLGIEENNLPLANAAEWELKCQRASTNSLHTLFHKEPSPQAVRFVPRILLPKYGWHHAKAGIRYPHDEMSFRQTINAISPTNRGFKLIVNYDDKKVEVSFDFSVVSPELKPWLSDVKARIGLADLNPRPYWGFDDLFHTAGIKLQNTVFVVADVRRKDDVECFHYSRILMLQGFQKERFIRAIANGNILVDFDARTRHNHGTKFRLRQKLLPELYENVEEIV